jgi:hypothetical protein
MWFICTCKKYHFSGIKLDYIQANMAHKENINYEIAVRSMADRTEGYGLNEGSSQTSEAGIPTK